MDDIVYKAYLLAASTTAAVLNNVKHYTKEGVILETPLEILGELESGRRVTIDETNRVERVSTEEILKRLLESSSDLKIKALKSGEG